jgi:flagellin
MSGLRINTNLSSLNALRNLHVNDRAQARSLERLSSGLRINRGADDPSGLVISERLRSQISALQQNSENSQNAANLIATADASLAKISDLLIEIQDSVEFALNTGGASADQIAAEQDSVDQAIAAIDRIANTTRYGDRSLLNGTSGYQLAEPVSTASSQNGLVAVAFTNVEFRSVNFIGANTERDLRFDFERTGQRAEINLAGVGTSGEITAFRITGARGAADVKVASGASAGDIALAINSVAQTTGVFAHDDGTDVVLRSEGFGSDEFISIEGIEGFLTGGPEVRADSGALSATTITDIGPNSIVSDRGLDAQVSFQGVTYTGNGLSFNINTAEVSVSFELNNDLFHPVGPSGSLAPTDLPSATATTGSGVHLVVSRTGLEFQLRERAVASDRLAMGIRSVGTSVLGINTHRDAILEAAGDTLSTFTVGSGAVVMGGFLSSLRSGQGNDLTQNAANALDIVNAAAAQVAGVRGFLGAVVGFNVEPNIDSLDVAIENLSASMSSIRDLDFAEETANFTRTQILFQSGIAALASARLVPQAVLQLLG